MQSTTDSQENCTITYHHGKLNIPYAQIFKPQKAQGYQSSKFHLKLILNKRTLEQNQQLKHVVTIILIEFSIHKKSFSRISRIYNILYNNKIRNRKLEQLIRAAEYWGAHWTDERWSTFNGDGSYNNSSRLQKVETIGCAVVLRVRRSLPTAR